ncbi:MAG: hypothetical protein LW629_12800 [Burkholderiales bacterium]|nr:hypothetical protein [Burkholderiales bacterium]
MTKPQYGDLVDTAEAWLGKIPVTWKSFYAKRIFQQMRIPSKSGDIQLTASQKYGVIPQTLFMKLEDQKVALAIKGTEGFKRVQKNDFIISLRSFQGGIEVCHYDGCVSPAYVAFRMGMRGTVSYFAYLFKSQPFIARLQSLTDGMRDGKMVSFEEFGGILLPFPDYLEQRQVVAYLNRETSKIDRLIAKQERLIELLQEKRQAVISRAVTKGIDPNVKMKDSGVEWLGEVPEHWVVTKLKRVVADKLAYGANESPQDFTADSFRYIRITDISADGQLNDDDKKFLPRNIGIEYQLSVNDVLLARSGGTVGKSFIFSGAEEHCCYAGYLIKCTLDEAKCLPPFFKLFTETSNYWEYISGSQIKSTIENVSAEKYGNMWLPLPPIEEQKKIQHSVDKKISRIRNLIITSEKALMLLKEHRQALISAAVTGKIDVRELVTDEEVAALDAEPEELPSEVETATYMTEEEQG